MTRHLTVIGAAMLGFMGAAGLSGCFERGGSGPVPVTPARVKAADAPKDDVAALAAANNRFAADVYARLRTEPGNIVFSPYSIHSALTLASAGARGPTLDEMRTTLRHTLAADAVHPASAALLDALVGDRSEAGSPLHVANALWLEKTYAIQQPFRTLALDHYLAPVTNVDFAGDRAGAVDIINQWTRENTGGLIPASLDAAALDPLTRLIISNAACFKGEWAAVFRDYATRYKPFHLAPTELSDAGALIQVPTMHNEAWFGFAETSDLKLLRMAFKSEAFSMVFVLPQASQGLAALEEKVSIEAMNKMAEAAREKSVEIALPKFDFRLATRMKHVLSVLGMQPAFDSEVADFSGIAEPGQERLFIAEVFHEAAIIVDEKGAKAAASTHVGMAAKDGPPRQNEPPRFIADQPFLFFIRHEATGAIIFAGRVSDPRGETRR